MAGISLSMGVIFSSLTTKYRDITFLIGFGVSLLMYATPVIYPLSTVPTAYKYLLEINPLTPVFEAFKYGFCGTGSFSWWGLCYSALFTLVSLFLGILIFNKVERNFMDTV
jgi:lipopolysaccharide transport system permease protein